MKVEVKEDQKLQGIEVLISCPERTAFIDKIVSKLEICSMVIKGKQQGKSIQISADDIFYFDTVDNHTYIYCKEQIYECDLKLYELEEKLTGTYFARINKACLLNLEQLKSVKAQINGRMLATLKNGEQLIVNRSYVKDIKDRLNH